MKVLVASRNAKKLGELNRVLERSGVHGIELVSLSDVESYPETPESGRTFGDNALIKARDGAANTGLICVADDSGLSVDELNGMPGVLSARWCGEHGKDEENTSLLLNQMHDVPDCRRGAAFVSVCALVIPPQIWSQVRTSGYGIEGLAEAEPAVALSEPAGAGEFVVEGRWSGRIIRKPRGENGFGYDPIFVPQEEDDRVLNSAEDSEPLTSAEMTAEEKDALSHRGRALAQLISILRILGEL